VVARWEWVSFTIPLTDAGAKFTISVSGVVVTDASARATLIVATDGHPAVMEFGPNTEKEFAMPVVWTTFGGTELHISVGVLVERTDSGIGDASLTVSTIDGMADIADPIPSAPP
jgi:hypothetical protein